jgi:hypothetical protein
VGPFRENALPAWKLQPAPHLHRGAAINHRQYGRLRQFLLRLFATVFRKFARRAVHLVSLRFVRQLFKQ